MFPHKAATIFSFQSICHFQHLLSVWQMQSHILTEHSPLVQNMSDNAEEVLHSYSLYYTAQVFMILYPAFVYLCDGGGQNNVLMTNMRDSYCASVVGWYCRFMAHSSMCQRVRVGVSDVCGRGLSWSFQGDFNIYDYFPSLLDVSCEVSVSLPLFSSLSLSFLIPFFSPPLSDISSHQPLFL